MHEPQMTLALSPPDNQPDAVATSREIGTSIGFYRRSTITVERLSNQLIAID